MFARARSGRPDEALPLHHRSASEFDPGVVLAKRYRIRRLLGVGGMARVYEAEHIDLERPVAIKVLDASLVPEAEMRSRFRQEARLLGSIRNEHVVAVQDVGETDDGFLFLVMELLEGKTLRALLREESVLPLPRAAALALQVCRGLAAAHALGAVHRDLKPENLFVTQRSDGTDWVKILDFGIAKLLSASNETLATEPSRLLGTPCYMSPERIENKPVTAATDIHSVGLMLYECLAGRPAFSHVERVGVLLQVLQGSPPNLLALRPELPSALIALVNRALDPTPARRFQTVTEMAKQLALFAGTALATFPSLPTFSTTIDVRAEPVPTDSSVSAGKVLGSARRLRSSLALGLFACAGGFGAGVLLKKGDSGVAAVLQSPARESESSRSDAVLIDRRSPEAVLVTKPLTLAEATSVEIAPRDNSPLEKHAATPQATSPAIATRTIFRKDAVPKQFREAAPPPKSLPSAVSREATPASDSANVPAAFDRANPY